MKKNKEKAKVVATSKPISEFTLEPYINWFLKSTLNEE
jgi:hypothetical protein